MKILWLVPCALLGAALGALLGQVLAVYVFGAWMPWGVAPHAYFAPSYFRQGFLLGVMTIMGANTGIITPLWWLKTKEKRQPKTAAISFTEEEVWPPAPKVR